MPQPVALRLSQLIAAVAGGVIVAMVAQIMLAHRGLELLGVWKTLIHGGGGRQLSAAIAWWAITGVAFVASFLIAALGTNETKWIETLIVGICLTVGCALLFPYVLGLPMPLFPRFLVQ